MGATEYLLSSATGYLLGSIPTAYLVARAKGIDIRQVGSGNIGATNAFRVLGKPAGSLVLAIDALKGALAAAAVPSGLHLLFSRHSAPASLELSSILGGVSAVIGHNYPVWLRFKGGKGIATSAGAMMALVPMALLAVLSVWVVVFLTTRFVSVASLCAAALLPFAVWAFGSDRAMIAFSTVLSLLAIYKHKANIKRLLEGTEHRFSRRARPPNQAAPGV